MKKEKVQKSPLEEEIERRAKQSALKEGAAQTRGDIEAQIKISHERWQKAYNLAKQTNKEEDIRRAYGKYRMLRIMIRLRDLTVRIEELSEEVLAIDNVINVLQKTNELFKQFLDGGNIRTLGDLKKNLKKFNKYMRKMERKIDKTLGALDGLFDEKPNIFQRIFGRKKQPDYMAIMEGDQSLGLVGETTAAGSGSAPAAPSAPVNSGSDGGSVILPPVD